MPRLRTLKPEFFTHETLAELSPLHRLLFQGLWCHADREGRLEDRPKYLKTVILPYDACDVDAMLWDLARNNSADPFIIRYEANGKRYIQIPKFSKHQMPHHREKLSEIPPHPSNSAPLGDGRVQPEQRPGPSTEQPVPSRVVFGLGGNGLVLGDVGAKPVSPSAATAPNGQGELLDAPPAPEPAKPKRPPNAVAQWHERACKARVEVVGPAAVDATSLTAHQWPKLGEALKAYGEKLLDAAFARFLVDKYALERDCPVALFVSQVDRWMTEAKAGPQRPPETAAQRLGLVGRGSDIRGPCAVGCDDKPGEIPFHGHLFCYRCYAHLTQEVANFNAESVSAWVMKARAA